MVKVKVSGKEIPLVGMNEVKTLPEEYDSENTYDAGALEVTITFKNASAQTGEAFKMSIEHGLGTVAADLSGEVVLLPNHDPTGLFVGDVDNPGRGGE